MSVEGVCDIEVIGDEVAEPVTREIRSFRLRPGDGYIGAAEFC